VNEFGIGQGDSEKPDGYEDFNIAAPEPDSLLSPEWQAAIAGLGFGSVEPLIEALESAEPIPPECETFLALALRGDPRLTIRLVIQGAPLAGQKRAGRPRRHWRLTSAELADDIEQHALELERGRKFVAAALRGDRHLPFRVIVKSNSGGRFPARTGERNLMLAVKMLARLAEKQARGERDPYRAAARQVADECLVGSSTVEKAYEQNREVARDMRKWGAQLRDFDQSTADTGSFKARKVANFIRVTVGRIWGLSFARRRRKFPACRGEDYAHRAKPPSPTPRGQPISQGKMGYRQSALYFGEICVRRRRSEISACGAFTAVP
jgi:hypothetical protein